ncbi:MAG: PD40 domain-containing protein, partial [Flavobacteriales bacterium]|nr:PD40 domain-containing protein [Flavobacteriales bacterium]
MLFSVTAVAQYGSEAELKEAADKMFNEEKYNEALPLFGQLLSLYPKDLNYNYKYGACVLYGSKEKEDALKYLKFATSKSTVDAEAFYFLGRAYHHNYQFAPAKVNYNKFKQKADSRAMQRFDVDRDIAMCENGEGLIKSMTDIGVLSKKDIKASDFFRSYDLKGIGGKIVVKPDEFKTKLDKKKEESSIIYLGEKRDMVVFSSYGKTGTTGKDIYKVVMQGNGEWSDPVPFAEEVNSKFDEDYPFLHPDGKTLYFCSKGFNSMGGYDVFKSTFDARTGRWSAPKNLDFPINTPDDDILFISDIDNELAYFASSRDSKQGELTVYRVTVDAPPVE